MHSGPQSSRSRGAPRSACTRSAAPQREGTRGTASTDCHLAHSGIYTYPCSSGSVPKLGHLHQCEFTVFCHKTHSLLRRTNAPGEKRPKSLHMQYTYCAYVSQKWPRFCELTVRNFQPCLWVPLRSGPSSFQIALEWQCFRTCTGEKTKHFNYSPVSKGIKWNNTILGEWGPEALASVFPEGWLFCSLPM